jgi:hypothetical protein
MMIAAMAAAVSAISVLRLMSDCAGFSVTTRVDDASPDLVVFEVAAGGNGAGGTVGAAAGFAVSTLLCIFHFRLKRRIS